MGQIKRLPLQGPRKTIRFPPVWKVMSIYPLFSQYRNRAKRKIQLHLSFVWRNSVIRSLSPPTMSLGLMIIHPFFLRETDGCREGRHGRHRIFVTVTKINDMVAVRQARGSVPVPVSIRPAHRPPTGGAAITPILRMGTRRLGTLNKWPTAYPISIPMQLIPKGAA